MSSPRSLLAGACGLFLSLAAASAQDNGPATNWPLPPSPPPGTNPALYPMPRNDWMVHFTHDLDLTKNKRVDLLFDGDSITDGWQGAGKEVWAKYYGKRNAVDVGIGGDRTEQILWRLDHGQVKGIQPKLIALMIGTNNVSSGNKDEQIAEAIGAIVKKYQALCPNAVILLQAIFPRSEKATDYFRPRIKNINSLIAKLGDGKKVIFIDFGDKFLQPDGTLPRDVMPDLLHPNAKGYEIWADAIQAEVDKVLGPAPAA